MFSAPIAVGDIIGNPGIRSRNGPNDRIELSWVVSKNLVASVNGYYTQGQGPCAVRQERPQFSGAKHRPIGYPRRRRLATLAVGISPGYVNGALQNTTVTGAPETTFTSAHPRSELFPTLTANAGIVAPLPWIPVDVYVEARDTGDMKPSESNFVRNSGTDYVVPAATHSLTRLSLGTSNRSVCRWISRPKPPTC